MRVVIPDTNSINYLVLIGHIDIVPALFDKVVLPAVVRGELTHAPALVRHWIAHPPPWVEILATTDFRQDVSLRDLDAGEEDAARLPSTPC